VQIEPHEVRVPRRGREHPGRVGIGPHAPHAATRARTERDAPLDRGAADAGQGGRVFHHRIGLQQVGIAGFEPAAFEQTLHPRSDPRQHDADLLVRRRRQGPEIKRAVRVPAKKTPSKSNVWKWRFRFNPPPKHWMTVTHPDRPSRIPRRRARWL